MLALAMLYYVSETQPNMSNLKIVTTQNVSSKLITRLFS